MTPALNEHQQAFFASLSPDQLGAWRGLSPDRHRQFLEWLTRCDPILEREILGALEPQPASADVRELGKLYFRP